MKEVLVHIGMHKTGSTSIQKALEGYEDKTTRYASFGVENHSIPIFTMFSKHRYDYHIWRNQSLTPEEVDSKRNDFFKVLEADLSDQAFERLIISGEDISVLDLDEKRQFMECLSSKGLDIKIIMFTRSPLKMAAANIAEYIKTGINNIQNYNIEYKSRIDGFSGFVKKENFTIIDYDSLTDRNIAVVSKFSEICDVDISSGEISNQSFSIQAMALLFRLNRVPIKVFGNKNRMMMRKEIMEKISRIFSLDNGCSKPDPQRFRYSMGASARPECDYLRENFGITYECGFPPQDPARLIAYFDQCLVGFDAKISELFAALDTEYDPLHSFEANFTEVFFNMTENRPTFPWNIGVKKLFANQNRS